MSDQDFALDADQERIAKHLQGGLLVLAPVGSGKTTALIERIANAMESGLAPERICCLTFTNRAALEVERRLRKRFPRQVGRLIVSTFHGLCATILRQEARLAGLPADFAISDEADSIDLLRDVGDVEYRTAVDVYHAIGQLKSEVNARDLTWPVEYRKILAPLGGSLDSALRYQQELADQRKLDFSDLVLQVNALFARVPEVRQRWAERYDFVQVDEVQDVLRSEYRVVYVLARKSGNLALFGDTDQTIYEWRGSDPSAILNRFRQDFAPVTTLQLGQNHRATQRLVRAASSFAGSFSQRATNVEPGESAPEGPGIVVHRSLSPETESRWIAGRIRELRAVDRRPNSRQLAVLTRTNQYGELVARGLEASGVPCVTVEEFDFFRRQEIKDALAPIRLLFNQNDTAAAVRMVELLAPGVGKATTSRVRRAGEGLGLRLTDLLDQHTLQAGDPFGTLLGALKRGRLVVLGLRTTGQGERGEELAELAAVRLIDGEPAEVLQTVLLPTKRVRPSREPGGVSPGLLEVEGVPKGRGLADFAAFLGDDPLVAHNLGPELALLEAECRLHEIELPAAERIDTLQVARRFVATEDLRLASLTSLLEVDPPAGERALDLARATARLLGALTPRLEKHAEARRGLVSRERARFAPLANQLAGWRKLSTEARPSDLLERVLEQSGRRGHYADDQRRQAHLGQLVQVFRRYDDPDLEPRAALREILVFSALVKNLDLLGNRESRVPILTIHQAKGLEFDDVFVAGVSDRELPSRQAAREGRQEEERRLFYVALTRARENLFISYASRTGKGFPARQSPFINAIDPAVLQRI
jgi:DNA helicase-2/ATP-dependent DNA helicase PcrA